MAAEPEKVIIQAQRIDATLLPPGFSLPYRLYVIQQTTDMANIANASNNANELAYQATVKNEQQDVVLADHESRISALRAEVDDHEIRITVNTSSISALSIRVTTAEGNIATLQGNVSSLQGSVTTLTTRITTAEGNITSLQGDYVSKSITSSQSLASPLNVSTSYSIGGVKVVGVRNTGWTTSTGTPNKVAFDANYFVTASATYTQSNLQDLSNSVTGARQRIKALEDALRAHGLID